MKSIFFIPKSWKRKNKPSQSSSDSSFSRTGSFSDSRRDASISSTRSTPGTRISTGDRLSPLIFKRTCTQRDDWETLYPKPSLVSYSSLRPEKPIRPSLDIPSRPVIAPVKMSSDDARYSKTRPPLMHAASNPVLSTTSYSPVSPPSSTSLNQDLPPLSHHRVLRSKRSMPELDGVWKGFLDDVEEDDVSILLESPLTMDRARHHQHFHHRPDRDATEPKPISSTISPNSMKSYSESVEKFRTFSPSSSRLPYLLENRMVSSSGGDKFRRLSRRSATDLRGNPLSKSPLSLFPAPPPTIPQPPIPTSPIKPLAPSSPSDRVPAVTAPVIDSPHPPMFARKHPAPQPLDLRNFPIILQSPHTPSPDSPLPCTPSSPRSPTVHSPLARTTGSPVSILKKTPRCTYNSPHPTPPSPPITPDYFAHTPSSHTMSPVESEKLPPRARPRLARSSTNLRDSPIPLPGAHRATSSAPFLHTDNRRRTLSRPEVPMQPPQLNENEYIVSLAYFLPQRRH
jgi:hypothetical protein